MKRLLVALLLLPLPEGERVGERACATLRLTPLCQGSIPQPSKSEDRVFGSPGMTELISEVEASDESGPLPLINFTAARATKGRLKQVGFGSMR